MLDQVEPEHFDPMFDPVGDSLVALCALDRMRRLGGRTLIAPNGTEYFTSYSIGCERCSTSKKSNGIVQNFHAMIGSSIVAPGTSRPLPPKSIRPQDGAKIPTAPDESINRA